MKKLFTLAVLAAASSAAFASNEITGVFHSKYSAKNIEVHFYRPEGHNGLCEAEFREVNYPNTVWITQPTRYVQGPYGDHQYVNFNVPSQLYGEKKQVRIVCGNVQKVVNLPSPPKVNFTMEATAVSDGIFDIEGGVYVEGFGSDTTCKAIDPRSPVVGHKLFEQQLSNKGSFSTSHITLSASNIDLFERYGHASVECFGVGGGVEMMLEFRENDEGGLTFTQQEVSYK